MAGAVELLRRPEQRNGRGGSASGSHVHENKIANLNMARDAGPIEPESYTLDAALLERSGNVEVQLALFRDYETNVGLYPRFHEFLRKREPPVLAVWRKNDQLFIPLGVKAFKKDGPSAEVKFLDADHFELETSMEEVAETMLRFLKRQGL